MFYRLLLALKKPGNTLWITPTLGALLAIIFAFAAKSVNFFIDENVLPEVQQDTLDGLLGIIASSMLAVSTFSLSIMVSAFASASGGTTPRATELVMGDDNTRMAIASFISAFIYAIIAKTVLGMGFYGQNGRFVLFVSTLLVLLYLIITLIRWVATISHLGGMKNTLEKIHCAAENALQHYRLNPSMGANWVGNSSEQGSIVYASEVGYLTHIDMLSLQRYAEKQDCYIAIKVRPGELISPNMPLMSVENAPKDKKQLDQLAQYFVLAGSRHYEEDPEWGFIVLAESAQKALPPVANDPGTAIAVMNIMMRILITRPEQKQSSVNYDRLAIKPLDASDWIKSGFAPIARDGVELLEVNLLLQKNLAIIWQNAPEQQVREAALQLAISSLQRAEQALTFSEDFQLLQQKHNKLFDK
ncbi:putative membrane protein [Volucribacter psittacicida]|uniref:Putative membrane protein n=1 Tax=Volucribacter psittacicida TaxID=203482 RepID=A0A4R1G4F5_9PAST|nr:DUF2254 family protein [Volucribacter psittacicida]TCK01611.1 putative membrane protein [Volucribacter psittacicida]